MDENQDQKSRRQILKAFIVGGAATTVVLPAAWQSPLVRSVIVPAHAQASPRFEEDDGDDKDDKDHKHHKKKKRTSTTGTGTRTRTSTGTRTRTSTTGTRTRTSTTGTRTSTTGTRTSTRTSTTTEIDCPTPPWECIVDRGTAQVCGCFNPEGQCAANINFCDVAN